VRALYAGPSALAAPAVVIGVRPEDMSLGVEQADNRVRAKVRTVIFLGSYVRLELALEGGESVMCDLRARALIPTEGETVLLGWAAADSLLYPVDDARA
jgi:hypothetical protein